jgi:ATP-binding cassette subfamily B protein
MDISRYKQLDSMDYGFIYLMMIAKLYGKSYTLKYLRSRSYVTISGVSMLGISDYALSIGFLTHPSILHWIQRYFIAVYHPKTKKDYHLISPLRKKEYEIFTTDPALLLLKYTKKEFCRLD